MLPSDLENYLSEISRVTKPGGKCLITFFLLNKESEQLIHLGKSDIDFRYKINGCFTNKKDDPETAIAYPEQVVKRLFDKYKFNIVQPIKYGGWCNRKESLSYQDIIIAVRD